MKVCIHCGKTLPPMKSMYCSYTCRNAAYRVKKGMKPRVKPPKPHAPTMQQKPDTIAEIRKKRLTKRIMATYYGL